MEDKQNESDVSNSPLEKSSTLVVKVDNSFNKTHAFDQLKGVEQDVSYAIISKFSTDDTDNKEDHVVDRMMLDGLEIKKLAGINSTSKMAKSDYEKLLYRLRHFFLTQYFIIHVEERDKFGKVHFIEKGKPIFTEFNIFDGGEWIEVKLDPEAAHFFTRIFEGLGFTIFALQNIVSLRKPTEKTLYRLFLDGKHIKGWNADFEEISSIFGFKKRTAWNSFLRRLNGYLEDIRKTGDFDNISYDLIRDKSKRGHPIVSVFFNIRVKSDRVKKLVSNYHADKPKKRPVFHALSISRDSFHDTVLSAGDGNTYVKRDVAKKMADVRCPKCGGTVLAFVTQAGKLAFCCENSKFWGNGGQNCNFYAEEGQDLRLNDDIKKWLDEMKQTIGVDDSIAEYLKKLEAEEEGNNLELDSIGKASTSIDTDPFPKG